ncbi:Arogenate dehydrogenase 2, chloroplastic [Turnera subulata]|uniref:Arogenate dehydrogenase 2, chloroplastic n=1 Tax=Turnera subulata TaxID=218843 RepID=A0A9Q0FQ29_9ROSI|nr:Arogenate dehydrogenase 2, chloroplastic [Turnera subulata]
MLPLSYRTCCIFPPSHYFLSPLSSSSSSISFPFPPKPHHHLPLRIRAPDDAAQPYYYGALRHEHIESQPLKIAIIGFGNFGQFLAKAFSRHGHTLLAHSRTNHSEVAKSLGVTFYTGPHDLCESHPDVVVLCTSILSAEEVMKSFPFKSLKRNTLIVDVLSVKQYAKYLLLKYLPTELDVLCTHPMFGPKSGKDTWKDLAFMYDKVRIGEDEESVSSCEKFIDIFAREGCRMLEMSCEEHDKYAAGSQFVTHTIGRVLQRYGLESSPLDTKGCETLLNLVENTSRDSYELYYGLFLYNQNALEQLERLDVAFEAVKKQLFGQLRQVYRKQLFGDSVEGPNA